MKACVVTAYGGPEVMSYQDMPDPELGADGVLVQVAGISINPVDLHERDGDTKDWRPLRFPAIIGWDVSGTVIGVGDKVKDLKRGDRVCAWSYHTYAELVADEAAVFCKVPDRLDIVDAAALPLVGTTGSQLISLASGVQAGQTVLVSGAAGGVGRSAVYTAKALGARVFAGVQAYQLGEADSIGADEIVALDDAAAFATIPPVDIVANAVRGKTAEDLMGKVKPGGTYASVTGEPANAKDFPSVRVVSFVSKQDKDVIAFIADAVLRGRMTIPIDRRIPLREAAAGQKAVAAGGIGKVLLVP
jgi:NADPH:quinone reductase-like Zn-dependent oxidoreductase